jgi:hypothetical protein
MFLPARTLAAAAARRAARHAVSLGCELIGERSDRPIACRATDLSLGGMWIETADPVRAGEQVVICFEPPGSARELMVFAEIARVQTSRRGDRASLRGSSGSGMGLEFLDLLAEEAERLASWLRRLPLAVSPRLRRWTVPAPVAQPSRAGTTVLSPIQSAAGPGPTSFRPAAVWR